jgi:hypothetical protein
MELTGWRFLPYPGGLLEQPEWLMSDLVVISANWQKVAKMIGVE